jgi:hypothetical protein
MHSKSVVAVLLAATLLAAVAEATVVVPMDLKKLTDTAQTIAHGQVVDVRSQWAATGHRIETVVTVDVTSYLKGNLGAQFIFRVPGGAVGPLRSVTVGAPTFRQGDEVVVFLDATGPAIPHVVGFNQGVFRVSVDARSGRRVVSSPMVTTPLRVARPIVRGDVARQPVALTDFVQRVRALIDPQSATGAAQPRRR